MATPASASAVRKTKMVRVPRESVFWAMRLLLILYACYAYLLLVWKRRRVCFWLQLMLLCSKCLLGAHKIRDRFWLAFTRTRFKNTLFDMFWCRKNRQICARKNCRKPNKKKNWTECVTVTCGFSNSFDLKISPLNSKPPSYEAISGADRRRGRLSRSGINWPISTVLGRSTIILANWATPWKSKQLHHYLVKGG
jgi:hypothetical protein